MKIKAIMFAIVFGAVIFTSYSQKGVQDGSKFGHGEDSIRCVQNLGLFTSYAKQGDYKSALEFWDKAYNECPASHISIYQYGTNVVIWQIEEEKDQAKKDKLFDRLMGLYDNRINYFGDNPKYGEAYILGRKAIDYVRFVNPNKDPLREKAYKWLSEAIDLDESANEAVVFQQYFILSSGLYKGKPDAFRNTYINDYLKITPMLMERAASGDPKDTVYAATKTMINAMFVQSGVAVCKTLDDAYGKQLDAKQKDKDFLKTVLSMYRNVDCDESNIYFKASNYAYRIEPTAGSASGLAIQAYNNNDFSKAISYFEEAVSLESNNVEKSRLQMKIAATYNKLGNYRKARVACQTALIYNPSNSSAYILIAHMYVQYSSLIDNDPVIQKTAYWAAADKLEKAKAVDPSCVADVNKMLSSCRANFPPKSELLIRKITGDTYTVPGWIQEKTIIR